MKTVDVRWLHSITSFKRIFTHAYVKYGSEFHANKFNEWINERHKIAIEYVYIINYNHPTPYPPTELNAWSVKCTHQYETHNSFAQR